jgi:caffeoyl-CoA O-methyltransferase
MNEKLDFELATCVDRYIEELFVPPDKALTEGLAEARAQGLPDIQVAPNEGKLLYLLARIAGAARILEIGTLGGYSCTWLARAVPATGLVVTLEVDPHHAQIARRNVARAGLAERVDIRVGPAADALRRMTSEGEAPFDLVFIDADKERYCEYLELCLPLTRPGSVILADNLIRGGRVLEAEPGDVRVTAVKQFNATIARHPRLDSLILPIIRDELDGLSISIVD